MRKKAEPPLEPAGRGAGSKNQIAAQRPVCLLQGCLVNFLEAVSLTDQEGAIAEPIYFSGDAVGKLVDERHAFRLKARLDTRPDYLQSVVDIVLGLFIIQGGEEAIDVQPLAELAHLRAAELIAQLVLAYEEDLEEFLVTGFDVRYEAYVVEALVGEQMGLIDDEEILPVFLKCLDKAGLYVVDKFEDGLSCFADPEDSCNVRGNLSEFHRRIRDNDRVVSLGQLSEKGVDDHGLTGADVTTENGKCFVFSDKILERRKDFLVISAKVKEPLIEVVLERRRSKSKMFVVHKPPGALRLPAEHFP